MNTYQKIIIYLSILLILLIIAKIIANKTQPVIKDTKSDYKLSDTNSFDKYMNSVYNSSLPDALIDYYITNKPPSKENNSNINILNTLQYFNYIYDNAPREILNNYSMADNLSFSWPPKLGSRYKLTAFPYPKSTNIFKAVYETISNTIDAYTFPGWNIQRRNPFDFNNSIYNNNFFRSYQYIEILHACYPPPGKKWPFCDDGGWWLYYAGGSGVFWNTGKCFVSLNKLSLLYDIYKCSLKTRKEIAQFNKSLNQKLTIPPVYGLSISDMVKRLEGKGGGKSITVAIFTIVEALTKRKVNKDSIKMIGFKNMKPSETGRPAWNNFITRTFLMFYLLLITLFIYFTNLKGKSWKFIMISTIVTFILLCSYLYVYIFVIFEDFFRGLGWMTLDMALDETNMNLTEFVTECVTGNLKNPTCNSLAMIQLFDLDVENHTFAMGYDSFILTSQPNKTGNWEVEICDLRNFNAITENSGIIEGGICGKNVGDNNKFNTLTGEGTVKKYNPMATPNYDSCKNNKFTLPQKGYILKSGPIELDNTGPPFYKPTKPCSCIEGENRLCTSCGGTLSSTLCINK
jgi:hypothetical protein